MKPDEIEVDRTYRGGLHGDLRTVTGYGSSKEWVIWAPTHERLPLGGFVNTRCTSRGSFAKWATEVIPSPQQQEMK